MVKKTKKIITKKLFTQMETEKENPELINVNNLLILENLQRGNLMY